VFDSDGFDVFLYKIEGFKGIDISKVNAYPFEEFNEAYINPMRKIEWGEYNLSIESQADKISAEKLIVGLSPETKLINKTNTSNYKFANMITRGFTITDSERSENVIIFRFKDPKQIQVLLRAFDDNFQVFLLVPKNNDEKKLAENELENMMN
jgi:hypothetical protein